MTQPHTPSPADLQKDAPENRPSGERGSTSLAVGVVEKIAGMAAREVAGIHALGSGFSRTFGAMRDRVPGSGSKSGVSRGIKAEVGEKQAAIDIALVVEYGVVIPKLAAEVRRDIIEAVERMTGLEVVEVNIAVNDVHLPDDPDDDEEDEDDSSSSGKRPRVQ
ncbi:putative alkaline shock family protein YloU [Kitasatospora sp. SolWspMP-SS2h]|uniref:Asp23/Gls24 family envelope stress response protein n=1 Tax=Kitasatospora sp. SolWspMP-SS2h TaxID=1305729 RepID=UPI000DBA4DF3|nr:Asp23/Gls24 family envelope stress response protein [Kitasatospora sp. SolWspMP-SS2h]RAJ44078.1 putative alkaline shock family protein YloU [Kitasatospora sp. SolWspMP-SS2h]